MIFREKEGYVMDQQVKRIKRELIKRGVILDIYTDTMQLPDGKIEEWDFVSNYIFIATPESVELSGDFQDLLSAGAFDATGLNVHFN